MKNENKKYFQFVNEIKKLCSYSARTGKEFRGLGFATLFLKDGDVINITKQNKSNPKKSSSFSLTFSFKLGSLKRAMFWFL